MISCTILWAPCYNYGIIIPRSPVLIIKAPALWLAEDYSNGVAGLTDVLVAYKQDASKLHPECGESDKVTVEVRNYFPPHP